MGSPNSESEFGIESVYAGEYLLGKKSVSLGKLTPAVRLTVLENLVRRCRPQLSYCRGFAEFRKEVLGAKRDCCVPNDQSPEVEKLPERNLKVLHLHTRSLTDQKGDTDRRSVYLCLDGRFVAINSMYRVNHLSQVIRSSVEVQLLDERDLHHIVVSDVFFLKTIDVIGDAVLRACEGKAEKIVSGTSAPKKEELKHLRTMDNLWEWIRALRARIQ